MIIQPEAAEAVMSGAWSFIYRKTSANRRNNIMEYKINPKINSLKESVYNKTLYDEIILIKKKPIKSYANK